MGDQAKSKTDDIVTPVVTKLQGSLGTDRESCA